MGTVGIITFHASHNCGSMLQAFALQQKVEEFGLKSRIIDYVNRGSRRMYGILPHVNLQEGIRGSGLLLWIKSVPYIGLLKRQSSFYKEFSERYLLKSEQPLTTFKQLCSIKDEYSHFITGSDQVWNPSCLDADDAYFLNFVKSGHKIAYAVSLGGSSLCGAGTGLDDNKYRKFVSDFDSISVRESHAVSQLYLLGREDVKLTIDPTLFYSKEEWESKLPIGERIIEEEYIFYYAFHYNSQINKALAVFSKKYNLPIYILDYKAWGPMGARYDGLKLSPQTGPLAFLNLVKYARMCFTTSFHGSVFSIIFEKQFWFIESGMHSKTDDRVSTLTHALGLMDRHVEYKDTQSIDINKDIDYSVVNQKLDDLKKESVFFLKRALE